MLSAQGPLGFLRIRMALGSAPKSSCFRTDAPGIISCMSAFDPSAYGPVIAELLAEERLPLLGPGTPNPAARTALDALSVERAFAHAEVSDQSFAAVCCSALWLYHDYLDESHTLSQGVDTPTGSYWHVIMHRREPDFSNAKYWFRRVGAHPIFGDLARAAAVVAKDAPPDQAAGILTPEWDPYAFIDLCERSFKPDAPLHALCRKVQQEEWRLYSAQTTTP